MKPIKKLEYQICIRCGELKAVEEFGTNPKGITKRCRPCLEALRNGDYGIRDAHHIGYSKLILVELGYDIKTSVYEQFKQRVKERYGKDI